MVMMPNPCTYSYGFGVSTCGWATVHTIVSSSGCMGGISVTAGGMKVGMPAPRAPAMCCWLRLYERSGLARGQHNDVRYNCSNGVVLMASEQWDFEVVHLRFSCGVLRGLEAVFYTARESVSDVIGVSLDPRISSMRSRPTHPRTVGASPGS